MSASFSTASGPHPRPVRRACPRTSPAASPPPEPAAQPPRQGDASEDRADGRASEPGLARVPIARSGKSLIVQVRLNGTREATLILDTGADITILSHAIALDLGLFPSSANPTVTLNTVGGQVRADVVRIGSVLVGEAEARDVLAVIHDLPDAPTGIDGLLGLTFLDKFVVTLDVQKGELQLRRR